MAARKKGKATRKKTPARPLLSLPRAPAVPVWRRSGSPPSMTLRRSSAPGSSLAGVRVSGWPRGSRRGSAPGARRPSRLRRYQSSLLKRVECAGRINAWRSPDELDHLLELDAAELGHNLVDAALMEQQNSRDDIFGNALSGGPAHIVGMKKDVLALGGAWSKLFEPTRDPGPQAGG
jgi:hypothetical protein